MKSPVAIEYHPENGSAPWVVVTQNGPRLWLAHRNLEDAAAKLTDPKYIRAIETFLAEAA